MKNPNRARLNVSAATAKTQAPKPVTKTGQGNATAPTPAPAASDPQPERPDLAGDNNTLVHYDLNGYEIETIRIPNEILHRLLLANAARRELNIRPRHLGQFILEAMDLRLRVLEAGEATNAAPDSQQARADLVRMSSALTSAVEHVVAMFEMVSDELIRQRRQIFGSSAYGSALEGGVVDLTGKLSSELVTISNDLAARICALNNAAIPSAAPAQAAAA